MDLTPDGELHTMAHRQPYRLCFVNSMRTWGGAEVWMLETARALVERGHAVEFVTNPGSELGLRARQANLPVKSLPIRLDGALWTIGALSWHLRRNQVTSLVANCTKDVTVAAAAGRLAGLTSILATRESDFPLVNRPDYRWNFRHLCTGILVNSQATRRTILQSVPWLEEDKVHLLYKGIDTDRFCPGEAATGRPVVGFVGQLIARKGLHEVMAAWTTIDGQNFRDRPRLRLAGKGPMRPELERWRAGLKHPQEVELLGYVEDLVDFYRQLRCLIMPSHAEGFGLAAAEALACAAPVIAGDASSLPEIVTHEKTGLLVPPGNSTALLAAINRLLNSPNEARQMGQAGRDMICQKFPREKTLQRLLRLTGYSGEKDQ